MTPQEVIKTFMSTLVNHDSSITTGTAMLDAAIKASSRFVSVQNVIDNIKADQVQAEREAVEEILGSDYAGKTMSEVGSSILNASATNYSTTKISNAYVDDTKDSRSTVRRVILERKAYIFLEKYCGIQLPEKYFLYSDTTQTYWSGADGSTGNVDTGAITGSDANITLTAGDVVYNTTMTSALMTEYAKQDGISVSGGNLIIGTGVEKTATSVVPEIGNKYTATANAAQNINTGSHDWIVVATDKNDTITTGGADSVASGAGNDKIVVGADYASILTGDGNDTVEIGADVNNITFDDLSSTDTVTVKGTFSVGSAQTDDTTLIVTDTTGNRTIYFSDYANSTGAKINGSTLTTWLSKAGIDLSNVSSASVTESATVDQPASTVTQSTGQLDGENHFPPADDENASTTRATQTLSKITLDDVTLLDGDIYVGSSKVGEISSDFPDISSFTKNGLTVNLYGVSSDKNGSDSKTNTVTLDQLSTDQKNILAGIFKWWAKECTNLNEDSYDTGFNSSTANVKEIDLVFYDSKGTGNTLASVGYTSVDGKAIRLTLKINMNYYAGMDADDADGKGTGTSSLLDRTLAHEMTHAIMASNITNFNLLPQFINEGIAELTHGIDDTRSDTIFGLAYNASNFTKALNLKDTGTGTVNAYAGGYMFLRYLAKQGSLQILTDYANPDAGASWSISGTTATYTVDGQTAATLTGLVKGLAVKGTEIEGISVDGNVITLSQAVLGTTKVSLGKNDNFTLALGSDLSDNQVEITNKLWSVSNGTATLKADYSTGYMLTDEGKSITYQSAKQNQTLATVKGLAKTGVEVTDFPTNSNVITLKSSMLGTSNVKLTGDGYTLALDTDAPTPTAQSPAWNLTNTTATYAQNTSAGFTLSDNSKNATYSAVTSTTLAKVTGIAKVTTDNQTAVANAINVSGNVITLGADALATSNVKVTGDYTLALASGAPTPTVQTPAWELTNTTATYKQSTSAGFTASEDAKTLKYSVQSSKTLATVTGIAKVTTDNQTAVAAAINVSGTTITLGKNALATSNVKVTGDGYTLALAANAPTAAVEQTLWETGGTKAVYKKVNTGYFTKQSDTVLAYNKETVIDTYATISGIRKNASTDSFSLSGNVITLTADALEESPTAKTKITLGKNDEYTLKLANGITKVAYDTPAFTFNKTTATLAQTAKTAGYSTSSDGKTITYVPENTSNTLATVTGIVNVTADNQAAVTSALSVSGTKISVNKDALTTSAVKVTGDGYTLDLASEALKPLTQIPTWEFSGNKATYKQTRGAGYTLSDDSKTIKYSGENAVTLATVSGLVKVTDDNKAAVAAAINLSGNVITLGADALATSKVTVKGDYTLALADDDLKPTLQDADWTLKGTTATYAQETTAGFTPSTDNKTLKYSKATSKTLATVSGIVKVTDDNKAAVKAALSVDDNVVTVAKDALGTSNIKVTGKGTDYTLTLAADAPTETVETNVWEVKGTKATYKTISTGYFTQKDDKTYTYTKDKTVATLATVSGLRKNAALDSFSLNDNVITLTADALDESPTAKTKVTLGKNDAYTLALASGIANVTYNDAEFSFNKTSATLAQTVNTAGYSTSIDGKTITYIVAQDAKGNATSQTLATVSGLVKVTDDNKAAVAAAINLSGNVITLGADALATSKVTVKGDYTLALADDDLKPTLQDADWTLKGTTATYAQETTAGFTPSTDNKTLKYSKATSKTLATVSGIVKVTDDNKAAVKAALSVDDNVVTVAKDALGTSNIKVTGKGTDYTLTLAADAPTETVETNVWEVKGTKATYKTISTGYFTQKDDKTYTYTKDKTVATLATVSGLRKNAALDSFSLNDNVITLTADALDESPTAKTKVTLGKNDKYTLALGTGLDSVTYNDPVWAYDKNKATYTATVNTAGYLTSTDSKTLTYIPTIDTKGNAVSTTLATVSGVKSADGISVSGKVISLGADALNEKKVTLGKNDDFTLALADSSLAPVAETEETWTKSGAKATLSITMSKGYTLSDDEKTLNYSNKSTNKILAQISGINKDYIGDFEAVQDGDTKTVTLKSVQLTSKVTVSGEYKFSFAAGYSNATITGSAQADNISVAGTGLVVNPGKGNDYVSLGGASNTIIYASGDGDDTIADFTAANDKIKVTKGSPELATDGNDALINVDSGSITLTDAAANVNNIIILDKNDAQIYPANSSALLVDNNFAQDDLHDITAATRADVSLGDLDLNRNATVLDAPTVTYGTDDDK